MLDKIKGLGNMASMLRQAEEFKKALNVMQKELQEMAIVVDSDDMLVKVTVNGQARILDLDLQHAKAADISTKELQSRILATLVKAQNRSIYVAQERRNQLFARYNLDKELMEELERPE